MYKAYVKFLAFNTMVKNKTIAIYLQGMGMKPSDTVLQVMSTCWSTTLWYKSESHTHDNKVKTTLQFNDL